MIVDIKERISPRRNAGQKPAIMNPGTIYAVSITSPALITRVKRPIDKKLIGKVSNIRMGLRMALANPRTMAAVRATRKLLTETPGRK